VRWISRALIGTAIVGTAVVGLVTVAVRRLNDAPSVPKGFVAPTTRPPAASPVRSPQIDPGQILFASNRTGNYEIWVMNADGSSARQLTNDPATDAWWPRPSPDRRTILFNRTPAGVHDRDYGAVSLWSMGSRGDNQVLLRPPGLDGWAQQGHAEWSPDGSQLVMFGGNKVNPQIYLTDAAGQNPTKLTDRGGTNIDPSFSPDGSLVTFVGCPRSFCQSDDYEIYTIPTAGGPTVRLTDDGLRDQDPYFSPDGSQIAWLTEISGPGQGDPIGVWDVRVAAANGSGTRRLTRDSNVTSRPIWSSDGKTVLVHRMEKGTDTAFQLFRIDVTTGALQRLTSGASANEYPG
jgi:Tol biopolymer transport system component